MTVKSFKGFLTNIVHFSSFSWVSKRRSFNSHIFYSVFFSELITRRKHAICDTTFEVALEKIHEFHY